MRLRLEIHVSCKAWCRNGETQNDTTFSGSPPNLHRSAGPLEPLLDLSSDLKVDAIALQDELDRRQVDQGGQVISEGSGSF